MCDYPNLFKFIREQIFGEKVIDYLKISDDFFIQLAIKTYQDLDNIDEIRKKRKTEYAVGQIYIDLMPTCKANGDLDNTYIYDSGVLESFIDAYHADGGQNIGLKIAEYYSFTEEELDAYLEEKRCLQPT